MKTSRGRLPRACIVLPDATRPSAALRNCRPHGICTSRDRAGRRATERARATLEEVTPATGRGLAGVPAGVDSMSVALRRTGSSGRGDRRRHWRGSGGGSSRADGSSPRLATPAATGWSRPFWRAAGLPTRPPAVGPPLRFFTRREFEKLLFPRRLRRRSSARPRPGPSGGPGRRADLVRPGRLRLQSPGRAGGRGVLRRPVPDRGRARPAPPITA